MTAGVALVVGCGPGEPSPCDQVGLDIDQRILECGGDLPEPGDPCDTAEGCYECTEERERIARCHSECVGAADCKAFLGSAEESDALALCMEQCYDAEDG